MKTVRYSKQREAILMELQSRFDHPTADQLYSSLKIKYPELSLGTVYRNLSLLTEQGKIRKLDVGDGTIHYDGITHPHIHFICKECYSIKDIALTEELINVVNKTTAEDIDFIHVVGTCKNCKHHTSH